MLSPRLNAFECEPDPENVAVWDHAWDGVESALKPYGVGSPAQVRNTGLYATLYRSVPVHRHTFSLIEYRVRTTDALQ